jgi:hypothetical protein
MGAMPRIFDNIEQQLLINPTDLENYLGKLDVTNCDFKSEDK